MGFLSLLQVLLDLGPEVLILVVVKMVLSHIGYSCGSWSGGLILVVVKMVLSYVGYSCGSWSGDFDACGCENRYWDISGGSFGREFSSDGSNGSGF